MTSWAEGVGECRWSGVVGVDRKSGEEGWAGPATMTSRASGKEDGGKCRWRGRYRKGPAGPGREWGVWRSCEGM